MKNTELRIGNYIDHNGLMEVKSIHPMHLKIYDHVNKCKFTHAFFVSTFNPIPLTEEWLLKFGFETIPHYTVTNSLIKHIGRNRVLSIGCTGTPNEMVFIQEVDGQEVIDLVCLHNYDFDGILYVHQLQNLYFALTGNELSL